jgi:hypothetical protein
MTHAQAPRRSGPSVDEDIEPAVTRVQSPRDAPRLAATMWLAAAFVVIAVLKPWGGGGPITATLRPGVAVPVEPTPVPTEDRTARGLAASTCLGTGGWRVATLETWQGRDVRVWRAIEPVALASGPLDPRIPTVPVVADVLSALGWCAPAFGPEQPVGPARVRAWQVIDGIARSVTLHRVLPEEGITHIAALYLPASGRWTTGLVVFQYADTGTGASAWFGADLRILGAPASSPATSPGPPALGQ